MANFKVGNVTHYFDKIGVAIIELTGDLSVGEKIKFERGGETLFEQNVDSIQVEHQKIVRFPAEYGQWTRAKYSHGLQKVC